MALLLRAGKLTKARAAGEGSIVDTEREASRTQIKGQQISWYTEQELFRLCFGKKESKKTT